MKHFHCLYFAVSVNLVFEHGFRGKAAMSANPQNPAWTAIKAIDGSVSQDYNSNSCAITDVEGNRNTSIWWKMWLQQSFNVAYLEIYFRSDSEYTKNSLTLVVTPKKQIHIFTFANFLPYIKLQNSENVQFYTNFFITSQ